LCRDSEEADVEKERKEQLKGPAAREAELRELAKIYEDRGLSKSLAHQVPFRRNLLASRKQPVHLGRGRGMLVRLGT
jgi:hypothetical protein